MGQGTVGAATSARRISTLRLGRLTVMPIVAGAVPVGALTKRY